MSEHDPDADDDVGILLVDDDPAFVEAAATFVGRHLPRARTRTAGSPADAREFLESRPDEVDCIVSDYDMAGETGLDFLRSVRAESPDLPFILFTGKGSEEVAGEAFRAGATDYLKKEMGTEQFEVLARRIEHAVTASRAEREATRNRKLLDAAVDAMDDLFYVFDTSGRFLRWNDALVERTGYSDEEVAEMHPTEFFDDADVERISEAIGEVIEGGDVTVEASVRTKGGESRRYEFAGSLLLDEAGDPFAVCGVGRDRSNRARIDELEAILDGLGVPAFGVGADETVTDANAACERLGVGPDDVGESAWAVLPWDADSEFAAAVREVAEGGTPVEVTVTLPGGGVALATCRPSGSAASVRVHVVDGDARAAMN